MNTRFNRPMRSSMRSLNHAVIVTTTICALLLTTLPKAALAQEGGAPLYLPLVSGGLGQPENEDADLVEEFAEESNDSPFTGFGEIPESELEAVLLAQASSDLPEPPNLSGAPQISAAIQDLDADGVPNHADNCPRQPNPPRNGKQPRVCNQALVPLVNRLVFLHSRIFLPPDGFDPGLKRTQNRPRIHVLLHVRPNDNGVMLMPQQRANLQSLDINLLGYLPHNTYFVSLPRDLNTLQQLIAMHNVRGISALRPKDKVAPQVRVQGPTMGRNDDGSLSFDVDFFADVPQADIETMLTHLGLSFAHEYENTYRVTMHKWDELRRLVIQDMVYFVDDLPDDVYERTQNAQSLINGQVVSNTMGFRGNDIVVSMTEIGLAEPIDRPDMVGRVTLGNNPIFEPMASDGEHPQMVSAIMIADETAFPTRAGLLPDAELISYSTVGLTLRAQHFGVNEEAHDDFGAILSNNSWGPNNCSKAGEYRKRGKYFDRAVYDVGIAIVYAAGNTRGPDGDFADIGCEADLYSLPHPVAKNDISVGNWDINGNVINPTSSAGPAADERLKPDIVAPGQGIDTVGWDEVNLVNESINGGGTSAASPVTSGVVGWLAESFLDQGIILDTIMPARYKAILVHTAKDVGPTGPDFKHGYGLIQADRAVRIAEQWSDWGREGTLDSATTQLIFNFDVNTPMAFYKATLVWDDEEGEHTSTMALKNDLDLTLVSPSGAVFFPYDVVLPFGATVDDGSIPCSIAACQDRLNNVEVVMVDPTNTDFIEQGTWQAVVDTNRLVSNEQSFSLVLTPPCPVELDDSVTLTDNINCESHPLEPTGVLIQNDGVNLNCDNHVINGTEAGLLGFDGNYVGVRVLADDVVVRNCEIRRFDVGIKVGDPDNSPDNASLRLNTLTNNGTVAIELVGTNHTARENNISQMIVSNGKGISVRGDNVTLDSNEFHLARNGGNLNNTVAILVHANSDNGDIIGNSFDGLWWYGIRLRTLDATKPVQNFLIDDNHFEGIDAVPIELLGEVYDTTISNNFVSAYGDGSPGINVVADLGVRPKDNIVSGNTVLGFTTQGQLGIQVIDADNTHVQNNTLADVVVGITEDKAKDTLISGNTINPVQPANNFMTSVGIRATDSYTLTVINNNNIDFSQTGIQVTGPIADAQVTQNTVQANGVAIAVADAWEPVVSGNGISARGVGISLSNGPRAAISANSLNMHNLGGGIVVGVSDEAVVADNTIDLATIGIRITGTEAITVNGNLVTDPTVTGIVLNHDTAGWVDDNQIDGSTLGIHYRGGKDAVVTSNTVNSLAGGIGIQLGTGAAGCPINVDNILVQDNVLNGGVTGVDVLCDVGTHTLINN